MAAPASASILIVDDEARNLMALQALLEDTGHQLVPATSGAEALRELRRAFPESPLTLRVAALNMLMRQQSRPSGYRPR